jgi:serine/threonine protein kinase
MEVGEGLDAVHSEKMDKYEIIRKTSAKRAYGQSFLARHKNLDRMCYLKVFSNLDALGNNKKEIESIARDMDVVARHPHVEGVHDFGVDANFAYLEMEWVGSYYKDFNNSDNHAIVSDWPEFLFFMADIASALDFAHSHNIFHGNIMWRYIFRKTAGGEAVLAGFGHAAYPAESEDQRKIGISEGAVGYLSPQQKSGILLQKKEDPENRMAFVRNDIWGMGAVIYHFICNQTLHNTDSLTDAKEQLKQEIDLSLLQRKAQENVVDIVRECLQLDPQKGYKDIIDLTVALKEAAYRAKGLGFSMTLWPPEACLWFKDETDPPRHNPQDSESLTILKRYLCSLGNIMPFIADKWLADKAFHGVLKHIVGNCAVCHGAEYDRSQKLPTMASVVLLFAASIRNSNDLQLINSLMEVPWKKLNRQQLYKTQFDRDINESVSARLHEGKKKELQEILLTINELFRSLSVLEGSQSDESAVEQILFDKADQGEIVLVLKFDCRELEEWTSVESEQKNNVRFGGFTTKITNKLNRLLQTGQSEPVSFSFSSGNEQFPDRLIIKYPKKVFNLFQ